MGKGQQASRRFVGCQEPPFLKEMDLVDSLKDKFFVPGARSSVCFAPSTCLRLSAAFRTPLLTCRMEVCLGRPFKAACPEAPGPTCIQAPEVAWSLGVRRWLCRREHVARWWGEARGSWVDLDLMAKMLAGNDRTWTFLRSGRG